MLQYLINATSIWLMSLVLFDVFLRKESYHNYNRFYLLFTLLLGALLPLVQWQGASHQYSGAFRKPIAGVITVKQTIVSVGTPASTSFDWQQWLLIGYLAGVFVAFALLAADVARLINYSRKGNKSYDDGWSVITTGRSHAPFSFMNTLFVSDRKLYSDSEWAMILGHEKRHASLLHFLDLLLMQAARIVFWFHPLVYIYNKRLLLVHEYQADNAAARQPKTYGSFLVEQSMLQAAPSIVHSFNRSPIKNRIVMLTRRSSAASRTKMLVFVPLALVCIVCFSKNGFSHSYEKSGNRVTWKGNTFAYSAPDIDTIYNMDMSTGAKDTSYRQSVPRIIAINGKPIPGDAEKAPVFTGSDKDLRDYLLKNMREELGKLKNGAYSLNITNIIVDEQGKIVYFEYQDMTRSEPQSTVVSTPGRPASVNISTGSPQTGSGAQTYTFSPSSATTFTMDGNPAFKGKAFKISSINNNYMPQEPIDNASQQEIFNKVCQLMETAPAFKAARTKGNKVACEYLDMNFYNHFQVKEGKIYDCDKTGGYKEL